MATARDIITTAFLKAGVLAKNETLDASDANSALDDLNDLLAEWSNDSMLIYARTRDSFTLTGGTGSYTIGTGQTFNTSRPVKINDAFITQSTTDYPMSIITDEVYDTIPVKTTRGLPTFLNYNNNHPVGTIRLWPVPSTSYTLNLLSEKVLSSIASLDTDIDFPPGWKKALMLNLALLLPVEYNQPIDPRLYEMAKEAKAAVKRAIRRNRTMDAQTGSGVKGNVYNGWFR